MAPRRGSVIFGVIVILVGAYLAAQALGLAVQPIGRLVGIYWPLLIALWGLVEIVERRGGLFFPAVAILFGLLLTATNSGLLPLTGGSAWQLLAAAVVIGLGLEMVLGKRVLRHRHWRSGDGSRTSMHWLWDDREPPSAEKAPEDV